MITIYLMNWNRVKCMRMYERHKHNQSVSCNINLVKCQPGARKQSLFSCSKPVDLSPFVLSEASICRDMFFLFYKCVYLIAFMSCLLAAGTVSFFSSSSSACLPVLNDISNHGSCNQEVFNIFL